MDVKTASNIVIVLYFASAYLASNVLDTTFWHILSVAFLIAGTYGIVCQFNDQKFIFSK